MGYDLHAVNCEYLISASVCGGYRNQINFMLYL